MALEPGRGMAGPDGPVGYLLRQAWLVLRAALDDELRQIGLTAAQYGVLRAIGEQDGQDGVSGAELARDVLLTPQTAHEIVIALEARGLLARRPDPADRRVRRIHLTQAGRALIEQARQRAEAVEARMVSTLAPNQQRQLSAWLVACATTLHRSPHDSQEGEGTKTELDHPPQ